MKSLQEYIFEASLSNAAKEARKCKTFGELMEKVYDLHTDDDLAERLDGSYDLWYMPYTEEEIDGTNTKEAVKAYRELWDTPIKVKATAGGNEDDLEVINAKDKKRIMWCVCADNE